MRSRTPATASGIDPHGKARFYGTNKMTPERWQQIKEVFHLALECEPAQRSSFLSRACDNDSALQREVESLLAAHEKDGSFIDAPAYKASSELMLEDQPTE